MKTNLVLSIALLATTTFAQAAYIDVIAIKLKPACTAGDFIKLGKAMNDWGKANDYTGEVLIQASGDQPTIMLWAGRSPSATAFGKAWDSWRNARDAGDPTVSKLNARWIECTEPVNRHGYDAY